MAKSNVKVQPVSAQATVAIGESSTQVEIMPKTFSTGSRGFQAAFKLQNADKRYQCNVLLVEIGSKNGNGKK